MIIEIVKIKEGKKFFKVDVDKVDEIRQIRLDKELVEHLSNATEREEEEIIKLLAVIEFIRIDSSKIEGGKVKSFNKIINRDDFMENLKNLLKFRDVDSIMQEISEKKYHELKDFFLN